MPGARVSSPATGRLPMRSTSSSRATQVRAFTGWGQRTHGRLNLKGLALDLVQRNGEVSIPFVLSDRGYGLPSSSGCPPGTQPAWHGTS